MTHMLNAALINVFLREPIVNYKYSTPESSGMKLSSYTMETRELILIMRVLCYTQKVMEFSRV